MTEEEIIDGQIEAFKEMSEHLIDCKKAKYGEEGFYDCFGCEHVGECMWKVHENLSALLAWVAQFITGKKQNMSDVSGIKNKISEMIEGKNPNSSKTPNLYS